MKRCRTSNFLGDTGKKTVAPGTRIGSMSHALNRFHSKSEAKYVSQSSVVISTYSKERWTYVEDCVNSLEKQSLAPDEIILVVDPNKELFNFYKSRLSNDVKMYMSTRRGLSHARNVGIRKSGSKIINFIDDDAVADHDWLHNIVRNYDDPKVLGVGGLIKPEWECGRPMWFPKELDWAVGCSYIGLPEHKAYVRNPIGCNMSFKKEVFKKYGYFKTNIGRFGTRLVGSEETELSLRVLQKNPEGCILYDPTAVVHHKITGERSKLKYLIRRSFYEGLSKALIKDAFIHDAKMSVERKYLNNLITKSFTTRLKRFYSPNETLQLLTLLTSISFVLFGYLAGTTSSTFF